MWPVQRSTVYVPDIALAQFAYHGWNREILSKSHREANVADSFNVLLETSSGKVNYLSKTNTPRFSHENSFILADNTAAFARITTWA